MEIISIDVKEKDLDVERVQNGSLTAYVIGGDEPYGFLDLRGNSDLGDEWKGLKEELRGKGCCKIIALGEGLESAGFRENGKVLSYPLERHQGILDKYQTEQTKDHPQKPDSVNVRAAFEKMPGTACHDCHRTLCADQKAVKRYNKHFAMLIIHL